MYIKHPIFAMISIFVFGFAVAKSNLISFNAPPINIPGQTATKQ